MRSWKQRRRSSGGQLPAQGQKVFGLLELWHDAAHVPSRVPQIAQTLTWLAWSCCSLGHQVHNEIDPQTTVQHGMTASKGLGRISKHPRNASQEDLGWQLGLPWCLLWLSWGAPALSCHEPQAFQLVAVARCVSPCLSQVPSTARESQQPQSREPSEVSG